MVDFGLKSWAASDNTQRSFEREGHTVQVAALAYDPDEDMLTELLAQTKRPARVRYDDVPRPTRALPSTARLLAWISLPSIIPVVLPSKPSLLNAAPQAVPPMASEVEPPHSASKVLPGKTPSNPKTRVRRELPMTRVRRIHLDSVHRQGHLAITVTSLAKQ